MVNNIENIELNFSKNFRRLRKAANYTQQDIAEAIGYSLKTISKWECGNGIPDIKTIYKLTMLLHTGIDDLFRNVNERYFLGIDGGGTYTELSIANSDGIIINNLKTDACNPIDIGFEASTKILRNAIYSICKGIMLSSVYLFAGISGGTSSNMKEKFKEFFSEFGFGGFINDSDNINIISAGLGTKDGMSLILGTGICCYTQLNGIRRKTSGWGYLIDDGGSAYNIGREALNAYYEAFDGIGDKTILSDKINKLYPLPPQELLGQIYSGGKKMIASFATIVYEAEREGDKIASAIINRNMKCAARIIETAANCFDSQKISVILAGGLTKQRVTLEYIKRSLCMPERYEIQVLSCPPVNGAVLLAQKAFNNTQVE